jgi:predicted O-methyltransferase YrrM
VNEQPEPRWSSAAVLDAAGTGSLATVVLLIQDAARLGQLELALAMCESARRRWDCDAGLIVLQSRLLGQSGRLGAAAHCLEAARELDPEGLVPLMCAAMLAIQARDAATAKQLLCSVIQRCPDYPGVAGILASVLMPGPNYRDVLAEVHRMVKPRGYLEIGVESGATLALARAECIIGIDPDLTPFRRERVAAHAVVFSEESQTFFRLHTREEVFGGVPVDLVFIDGLHRFDAALSDFLAVEKWVHENTVIVMHDALPIAPIYAEAERRTRFWVGDVWKAVFLLLRQRQDLAIRVIPAAPSGLVVIRCAGRRHFEIDRSGPFPDLKYHDPAWPPEFPLVSNDATGYAAALSCLPTQVSH